MKTLLSHLTIVAMAGLSACSSVPLTTSKEPMAIDYALQRARFEMNGPAATATVLSKQTIEPPMVGVRFGAMGVERAEFTIGVAGCDQRRTLVVVCADGADGCFAADGTR